MELYLSTTQPTEAIMQVLRILKLQFTTWNVDTDQHAHDHLMKLTGTVKTPTLVFDDDSYLIQPTPAQLAAKLESARSARTLPSWKDNLLTGIAFGIGLLSFAVGVGLGAVHPIGAIGAIFLFVGVALILVAFMPPLRKVLVRLSQLRLWKHLTWIIVPVYAGLMGLATASSAASSLTGIRLAALAITTLGIALFAAITRRRWEKSLKELSTWYSHFGLISLVAFLGLLATGLLTAHPDLFRLLIVPQLILFSVMLVLGSLQIANIPRNSSPMSRVGLVLFPCLGLVILLSLV